MRVRIVLLCCVALAAAKRVNREAGYNYQVPSAGHIQSGHTEHSSGLNQQYHALPQNDGVLAALSAHSHSNQYQANTNAVDQTIYQPQLQVVTTNTQAQPVQQTVIISNTQDSSSYPQEYTQQNDLYRFTAPSGAGFTSGAAQTFSHDASTSFGNSQQYQQSDVHQIAQFHGLPVVNSASDSITVESAATPAPIHHQPAPIHQQPAPVASFPAHVQQPAEQSVTVRKDIYLHVAPPDFEEPAIVPSVVTAPSVNKKHYKILFIKAPSFKQPTVNIPAPAQQDEEKTLVYVLVKKPEIPEPIIQKAAEPKTHKPEVYFIKYKSQKEQVSPVTDATPLAYLPAAEPANEHTHFDHHEHSVHHEAAVSTTVHDNGSHSTSHSTLHSGASNQYIPPVSH